MAVRVLRETRAALAAGVTTESVDAARAMIATAIETGITVRLRALQGSLPPFRGRSREHLSA